MDNNPPPNNVIPLFKKKNALESSLYEFFRTDPFYASFLQEIAIQYNEQIPTAAMTYNKEKNQGNDEHMWGDLSEDEKERMLTEAKKIVERTIEKSSTTHSQIPDSIKDLLQNIDCEIQKLDYKGILKRIIKKSLSCADRKNTWNRPSKRYGVYSPGTEVGKLPFCMFLNDSSGSISVKEQNEYLQIMAGFLKVGGKKCTLAFWHTNLYHKQPYKLHQEIDPNVMQSGGTDVTAPMLEIQKTKPNLAIILTDGYYDATDVKVTSEVLFIISKGGNKEHPMRHVGTTIMLENLM